MSRTFHNRKNPVIQHLLLFLCLPSILYAEYQWTFESNFGGPIWWGTISPQEWAMCKNGRQQSPININPSSLLFDKSLQSLYVEQHEVPATFLNTGQLPVVRLTSTDQKDGKNTNDQSELIHSHKKAPPKFIAPKVTGGPLGAYKYRLYDIVFHFGNMSHRIGSDHSVDGEFFMGEVQLMGYNTIYKNYTEALKQPHGIVAIAVMIEQGPTSTSELKKISDMTTDVKFKGSEASMPSVFPYMLLPPTPHYVTYEGSLTYPGCYETVTWIIMNKPIFISGMDFKKWLELRRTDREHEVPQLMMDNHRPIQQANNRLIRTNIQFRTKDSSCVYKDMYYRRNPNRRKYYGNEAKRSPDSEYHKRAGPLDPSLFSQDLTHR